MKSKTFFTKMPYREEFEYWRSDDPEAARRRVHRNREGHVLQVLRKHDHHGHGPECGIFCT